MGKPDEYQFDYLDDNDRFADPVNGAHLIGTVCKKLAKNKSAAAIADELEEDLQAVETVIKVRQQAGSYDVGRIYDVLRKGQHRHNVLQNGERRVLCQK